MKQFGILAMLVLATAANSHAQWQLGVSGGVAHYNGDLTDRVFTGKLARAAFGVHAKYEFSERLLLRANLMQARVAGDDRYQTYEGRRQRNLSFESNITELSAVAEVHTFRLSEKKWSPYVFGGLAVYRFNPYTYDQNNEKVKLRPLSTEGQGLPGYTDRRPYNLTQMALPFGAGLRFNLTDNMLLGLEVGFRKLFTDYLDDVSTNYAAAEDLLEYRGEQAVALAYRSDEVPGGNPVYPSKGAQRGSANQKDFYYVGGLSLSFRLGQGGIFGNGEGKAFRAGRKGGLDCPRNPN